MLADFATPQKFLQSARALLLPFWSVAVLAIGAGLWFGFTAPPDYQQGDAVRLLFLHVPNAWLALACYALIAVASAMGLIFRTPLAFVIARVAVVPGIVFTLLTIITGALWGKPIWGVWWVWDARLTSVVVLLFVYLGLLALWQSIPDAQRAQKLTAILALIGSVNLPIVKFSVDWWHTLHQSASVSRLAMPALHSDFLLPLGLMTAGWFALAGGLILLRAQSELWRRQYDAQQRARLRAERSA